MLRISVTVEGHLLGDPEWTTAIASGLEIIRLSIPRGNGAKGHEVGKINVCNDRPEALASLSKEDVMTVAWPCHSSHGHAIAESIEK